MKKNNIFPVIILMTCLNLTGAVSPSFANQNKSDSLFSVLKQLKTGDTAKVRTLNVLAYEFRNNDPDTAIYFANKSLLLATKLNDTIGIADAYLCLGAALINIGNYEEALKNLNFELELNDQFFTVKKASDKIKTLKQKASAYNYIGTIYKEQGHYPEGLKNHLVSLNIREEIKDTQGIAVSYSNIGLIYYMQGNSSEALKYYFSALKILDRAAINKHC